MRCGRGSLNLIFAILSQTTVPLHDNGYYYCSPIKAPVRSGMDARHLITSPNPNGKHRRPLTLMNERTQTNKRTSKLRPLLTPSAIARGACGHSPFYCRNTAWQPDHNPWFSLSPLDGVVTLREGLATGA